MFGSNSPNLIGGSLKRVGVEFTRPDNTTGYTAKDVVCNSDVAPALIKFADIASNAVEGSGYIVGIRLVTSQKANTAKFRLHLYHTEPAAIYDNVLNKLLYVDAGKRIAAIDLPAMSTEDAATSTCAESADFSIRVPYHTKSNSTTICGVLECLDAFVPDAQQKFYVELLVDNN